MAQLWVACSTVCSSPQKKKAMQHRIKAENIKCDGCVATIEEALQKLPGVEQVAVDKKGGWVTVTAVDLVVRRQLTDVLQQAGFPEQVSTAGFFRKLFS